MPGFRYSLGQKLHHRGAECWQPQEQPRLLFVLLDIRQIRGRFSRVRARVVLGLRGEVNCKKSVKKMMRACKILDINSLTLEAEKVDEAL